MTWNEAEKASADWHESLKSGQGSSIDSGEIIHKFPDGYYFSLIKDNHCDAESEAMGHCGTATNDDMYLISLRKDGKPYVTIDWHPEDKYVHQIRGRGNEKPVEKYKPYLKWLISNPNYVQELKTDEGYASETNFKLSDFDPKDILDIIKSNSHLKLGDLTNYEEDFIKVLPKKYIHDYLYDSPERFVDYQSDDEFDEGIAHILPYADQMVIDYYADEVFKRLNSFDGVENFDIFNFVSNEVIQELIMNNIATITDSEMLSKLTKNQLQKYFSMAGKNHYADDNAYEAMDLLPKDDPYVRQYINDMLDSEGFDSFEDLMISNAREEEFWEADPEIIERISDPKKKEEYLKRYVTHLNDTDLYNPNVSLEDLVKKSKDFSLPSKIGEKYAQPKFDDYFRNLEGINLDQHSVSRVSDEHMPEVLSKIAKNEGFDSIDEMIVGTNKRLYPHILKHASQEVVDAYLEKMYDFYSNPDRSRGRRPAFSLYSTGSLDVVDKFLRRFQGKSLDEYLKTSDLLTMYKDNAFKYANDGLKRLIYDELFRQLSRDKKYIPKEVIDNVSDDVKQSSLQAIAEIRSRLEEIKKEIKKL